MFAQLSSAPAATDKLASLVTFCEEQLPALRESPGFKGFYLLTDRQSGTIASITLWDSDEDLRRHQARGAEVRAEATAETGIASPPVNIYEVLLHV